MSDVYETLYYEGEIERLESELAAANESRRAWASAHLVEIENVGRLEAELAEAILKKKDAIIRWSRLYEEHGDVYRELAAANAKIERYEHWIFSCNDCGPAEYAQRQLLSPQGSLAGNPLREENGTTGGSPIRCDTDRCNSHRSDIACFLNPCPCRCHKSEVDPEC